jgi:carbon storage regulator CsrA
VGAAAEMMLSKTLNQPGDYVLILNRKLGEAIVMDGGIRVVVLQCDRRGVRLGIEAPGETGIFREELLTDGKAQVSGPSAPIP